MFQIDRQDTYMDVLDRQISYLYGCFRIDRQDTYMDVLQQIDRQDTYMDVLTQNTSFLYTKGDEFMDVCPLISRTYW